MAEVWIHRELPQSNSSSGPTEEPLLQQEDSLDPLGDTITASTNKPLIKQSSSSSLDCLPSPVPATETQRSVDVKTGRPCAPVITSQDEKSPKEKKQFQLLLTLLSLLILSQCQPKLSL